jgi:hypothetical protein
VTHAEKWKTFNNYNQRNLKIQTKHQKQPKTQTTKKLWHRKQLQQQQPKLSTNNLQVCRKIARKKVQSTVSGIDLAFLNWYMECRVPE